MSKLDPKEKYARVVELHESGRYNNTEIGRELGISEGSVRYYLAK